jgi:hypothetical protein
VKLLVAYVNTQDMTKDDADALEKTLKRIASPSTEVIVLGVNEGPTHIEVLNV